MKRFALFLLFCMLPFCALFAGNDSVDFMRSTGKIYVVVAVITATLIGLFVFLIYLDRKLTKLENQILDK